MDVLPTKRNIYKYAICTIHTYIHTATYKLCALKPFKSKTKDKKKIYKIQQNHPHTI